MLELLKEADKAGHKADFVLFDSWFSSPAQLLDVKNLGFDCIAMVKKTEPIMNMRARSSLSAEFSEPARRTGAAANSCFPWM